MYNGTPSFEEGCVIQTILTSNAQLEKGEKKNPKIILSCFLFAMEMERNICNIASPITTAY
jgi:hypothetical protein